MAKNKNCLFPAWFVSLIKRTTSMYLTEELTSMGINAPKPHQRVISKLTTGLGALYYLEKKINLEPLPETMIDEGQTSPVPDLLLYDNESELTRIIIEVCHPNGVSNDLKKVIKLIEENDYGILEGFVYDYKRQQWFKYRKDVGQITENPSYSDVIQHDLNAFLIPS